jgi:2-polyprenyl-3-methyl-5-hydroxy-6-metoxy-1,4-benzoquinol methylase
MDPLAGSPWSAPGTVAGFARSLPNDVLIRFAAGELARVPNGRAIDIGCGAGRNAVPLAEHGWHVLGTDWSAPMIEAAKVRAATAGVAGRMQFELAPMDRLPAEDQGFDLVIAHGIWNLAQSAAEFRRGIAEAARVAKPGAGLFVFTFSRHTLPAAAQPVAGEAFIFTEFSGQPQAFLTEDQLLAELAAGGFAPDERVPLTELNRPAAGVLQAGRAPVIYEAAFRKSSPQSLEVYSRRFGQD